MEDKRHWYKGETLWNHRRKTSEWHFDTDIQGEDGIKINFIKFAGDWKDEIANCEFKQGAPQNLSSYLQRLATQELIELGVSTKTQGLRVNVDPILHPKIHKMVETFGLENPYAQILRQMPGEMLPYHIDAICYDNFKRQEVTKMEDVETDDKSIRVFVALEDWCWGHYFLLGNHNWTHWKAGDVIWFNWKDIPHGTANCGQVPRLLLKITGRSTDKWEDVFKNSLKTINV